MSNKLRDYQLERRSLIIEMDELRKERGRFETKMKRKATRLKEVGQAIYDLKHGGDGNTPHITDHAIVRYLERVEKMDINELKLKVSKHRLAVREGNAIITVNEDWSEDD